MATTRPVLTTPVRPDIDRLEDLTSIVDDLAADRERTFGERLADSIASFGGSWRFIIIYLVAMAIWILVNTVVLITRPFDPYPFIFLNLILSCASSLQAPIIMMSQNRQEARDRLRADDDFRLSLRAESELRMLNVRLEAMVADQHREIAEIKETLTRLLDRSNRPLPGRDAA